MAEILLVEDESLLRWSLGRRLEKVGHRVFPAENLAQAARLLDTERPELVLLDLSLPDGNGLDFLEANRQRLDGAVVLVVTAVGTAEDATRARELGAADFLTKPVEHLVLVELIDRVLAADAG